MRVAVTEDRLACDLALGAHGDVIGELAQLNGEFPLRERLAWPADAGAVAVRPPRARRWRRSTGPGRLLATELGLDPGPELRDLHARLLADDPSLSLTADAVRPR